MVARSVIQVVHQDGHGGWDVDEEIDGIHEEKPVYTAPVSKILNSVGATGLALSPRDSNHADVLAALASSWPKREVRILREGSHNPFWWGVPVRVAKPFGQPHVTVACAQDLWHLAQRHVGKTNRTNRLTNPSFETGDLTGWTTTGVDSAAASTAHPILGSYAARLENNDAGQDCSIQQSYSFTSGGFGNNISVAAWFYIETWNGPPFQNRGLFAEWKIGSAVKQYAFSRIDENTARGRPERAEIPLGESAPRSLWVPPSTSVTINVRGYAIDGVIHWDAFFAGEMESVSAGVGGSDIATLAAALVNHGQDPAVDKDDIDMLVSASATGKVIPAAWQYAQHDNIWNVALRDLIARDDGIDVAMVYGPNSRTFTTYSRVGSATGKGVDRTGLDMSLIGQYVLDYEYAKDATQGRNSITVLGDGDGPDREEGGYLDLTKFGGRALEAIVSAPSGSPIDSLQQRATRFGIAKARPTVLTLQLRPGQLVTTVDVGDRLHIPAYDDFIDSGTYRVMDLAWNPANDSLKIGLNPWV